MLGLCSAREQKGSLPAPDAAEVCDAGNAATGAPHYHSGASTTDLEEAKSHIPSIYAGHEHTVGA